MDTPFEQFVYGSLKAPQGARSNEIATIVKDFLHTVEVTIPSTGNPSSAMRTRGLGNFIFRYFPHEQGFSLTSEMAFWLLWQHPPYSLLTKMGDTNLSNLLQHYDPLDILALTSWVEESEYVKEILRLIAENARPEHFTTCPIKPMVVSHHDFPALVKIAESSALDRLTCRVIAPSLHKGMGASFPNFGILLPLPGIL